MRVGILGSGRMGGKLGTLFARAGHEVVFSYARKNETLETLAREAGGKARAGSPRDAVRDADAVLLPLFGYGLLAVSALIASGSVHTALFGVGGAALLLLVTGIHNAWDSVTYQVVSRTRDRDAT